MTLSLLLVMVALARTSAAQALGVWQLVEEWRIGGDDNRATLEQVRDLDILRNGDLAILDGGAQRVVIVNASGKFVRAIGRKGGGPGEFMNASGLAASPSGSIVISDFPAGRFSVFDENGEFVRTVPVSRGIYSVRWDGFFDSTGNLFDPVPISVEGASVLRVEWMRRGPDLSTLSQTRLAQCGEADPPPTVRTLIPVRTASGRARTIQVPYLLPIISRALTPDGFEWSARRFGSNEIGRHRLGTCTDEAIARIGGSRAQVSTRDRDIAIRSMRDGARREGYEVPDASIIPRELPWFSALRVDSDRQLWVERSTGAGRRFHVFSSAGHPLGEIDIRIGLSAGGPMVITRDRLYATVIESDGTEVVVCFRIDRR